MKLDAELWHISQRLKDAPKKKKEPPATPVMSAVTPDAQAGPLLSSLSIMSLELRARQSLRSRSACLRQRPCLRKRRTEEKALGYRERPTYIRPVNAKAYEAALVERPRSGFPLFGMARSNEAAGDEATATKEYTESADAWKEGNPDLPQMAHARELLSTQKTRLAATK
jgi:hypothetical protein